MYLTSHNPDLYRRLVTNSVLALLLGSVIIFFTYHFVDERLSNCLLSYYAAGTFIGFGYFTEVAQYLDVAVFLIIVYSLVIRLRRHLHHFEATCFAGSVGFLIAEGAIKILKFIFGRTSLWQNGQCSWFQHIDPYTFHFFSKGPLFESFPSGHMSYVTSFFIAFWVAYPKIRWILVLYFLGCAMGLVSHCYHFLSDVIAGGILGTIIASFVSYHFQLHPILKAGKPS
ncbi:MAG TPA: phosphatase PAP2 family protein [Coxiellaceae bacterium]|nr:phosphatase PAP2 family protein [Coxiellaceae bacterium]